MQSFKRHYGDKDGLKLLSYNAVFSAVISNRNFGKTWAFKKRAFKRAMKHGKKTIWLRMFRNEVKECAPTFYASADLQKYCGCSFYDKDTNPNGNIKQNGRVFYYRKNPRSRWEWFLKIFALTDAGAMRSADDVNVDTIIFDEFTKTPNIYKRYHGNVATDLIDIFVSSKREHQINVVMLGNKESVSNPIFSYFGVKPLPSSFEGIRTYRNGSFAVQQINNVDSERDDYDRKVNALLVGTSYGDYLTKSSYKGATGLKPRKTPAKAVLYVQIYINSVAFKISVENGYFYINQRIDQSKPVYCDVQTSKYKHVRLLVRRHKRYFVSFVEALADNRVYYDDEATKEATASFMQWLGV